MKNKKLVIDFLNSEYYKDSDIFQKYLHPDVEISWNSSQGFSKMNFQEFKDIVIGMGKTFTNLTAEISHAIAQGNKVSVRFTYHVETLEHPESMALAHFFSFWEIDEDKIYKIFLMSQPADETPDNLSSYLSL